MTSIKPCGIMRLHEVCGNFAILQHTPDFELFYRCNACNANLHAHETIDLEDYIAKQQSGNIVANQTKPDLAFLPYQIMTFTKKSDIDTPVAANEFIVYDKTNHREVFFCSACKEDKPMILVPNNLKNLSFKRICETCRTIS